MRDFLLEGWFVISFFLKVVQNTTQVATQHSRQTMFATPALPAWLVDIIWFLGGLFVDGWLFFSLVMFIGGLVMLIIKPFVGVPQDGGGLSAEELVHLPQIPIFFDTNSVLTERRRKQTERREKERCKERVLRMRCN